jgi:L-gulonate 5-dehydrogenase
MKAVIIDAPKKMRVGDIATRSPQDEEVLVRIAATGICAGDLHIYNGKNPYAIYPCIGGHEIAGVVADTGRSVSAFQMGQHVVVDPFLGCGKCYPCRIGKYNCCVNLHILGVHSQGGFAEFLAVPARKLHVVPEGLALNLAAFAEPISIGIQACNRAEVSSEDTVLILGCGPIGMVTIEIAFSRGARVLAADTNVERLEIAREMGAETIISDNDFLKHLLSLTDGEGASVVIEATGVPGVMGRTTEYVAAGGRIVILGLVPKGVPVEFPGLDFTRKELTVLGSRTNRDCFPLALELLRSRRMMFPLMAETFSLWDSPNLFKKLSENPALFHKVVLLND